MMSTSNPRDEDQKRNYDFLAPTPAERIRNLQAALFDAYEIDLADPVPEWARALLHELDELEQRRAMRQ